MRNALALASLVLAALLCFGAAGWMADKVGGVGRSEAGELTTPSGAPPGVRFVTVALGGFRGLLVDALWVRAARLQDEGDFFEVAQLAEWITHLEPRYPEVWSYHAWNLAYNIGAMFPDPADRWHWVQTGIRLLRDEGIPANAHESKLYWELGWLFADKVGGRWDDAEFYYRTSLAAEMTATLGGGTFDREWFRNRPDRQARLASQGLVSGFMIQVDERYGPLDWRLPETHALYWATRGRPFQKPDDHWCERLVWSSLTDEVRAGALYFDATERLYLRGPQLEVAIKGIRACERENPFGAPLVATAAENFLREAMVNLYAFSQFKDAEEALALLRRQGIVKGRPSIEAAVREELRLRFVGLDRLRGPQIVEDILSNGYMWKALGKPECARGLEALARLYWDALTPSAEDTADRTGGQSWDDVRRKAKRQARLSLPEVKRAELDGES